MRSASAERKHAPALTALTLAQDGGERARRGERWGLLWFFTYRLHRPSSYQVLITAST